jgi:hypothetical protein
MSGNANQLVPLTFPLHGSRLIEASAGTGKTWTIAALYVRLVLGHGGENGYQRPLLPADILVMTFTRAATRELSNRVRERLVEAAAYFRGYAELGAGGKRDPYLDQIIESYPGHAEQQRAAHRLIMAAETMDEAAIFTIDAWCQRMLREHAFDSGSLFDEELVSDEQSLFEDAANDYWRQQAYPLNAAALEALLSCWGDVGALKKSIRELVRRADIIGEAHDGSLVGTDRRRPARAASAVDAVEGRLVRSRQPHGTVDRAQREASPKCFNGNKMRPDSLASWFNGLRDWAQNPVLVMPDISDTAWKRLTPYGLEDAFSKGYSTDIPEDFDAIEVLKKALDDIEPLSHALYRHAAAAVANRMAELKKAQPPVRLRRHAGPPERGAARRKRRRAAQAHHRPVSGGDGRRIPGYGAEPVPDLQPAVSRGGQRSRNRPVPDRGSEAIDLRFPWRRHPQLPVRAQSHHRPPLPAGHQLPLHQAGGRRGESPVHERGRICGRRRLWTWRVPLSRSGHAGEPAAVRSGRRAGTR